VVNPQTRLSFHRFLLYLRNPPDTSRRTSRRARARRGLAL